MLIASNGFRILLRAPPPRGSPPTLIISSRNYGRTFKINLKEQLRAKLLIRLHFWRKIESATVMNLAHFCWFLTAELGGGAFFFLVESSAASNSFGGRFHVIRRFCGASEIYLWPDSTEEISLLLPLTVL